MQFLLITKEDTLQSISRVIGSHNIDALLAENGLKREPNIGKQWNKMCDDLLLTQPNDITPARKSVLLNSVVDSQEVFEKVCLLDEDGWKIFSAFQAFRDAIRLPESVKLPFSARIIGSLRNDVSFRTLGVSGGRGQLGEASGRNRQEESTTRSTRARLSSTSVDSQTDPVDSNTYRAVMSDLKTKGSIQPGVFNKVNTSKPFVVPSGGKLPKPSPTANWPFPLPWGKIQLYSSIADAAVDIPAYPEQLDTSRKASYTAMPDILYQYEPWIMYEGSGPREQSLAFHLHRDMWSGNHLDGNANRLIRFCEANTFPRFTGSTVNAPIVRVYIDGKTFVSGVLTDTSTSWKGPIGQDNWYLEFDLTLTIQEISTIELNYDSVMSLGLIGT